MKRIKLYIIDDDRGAIKMLSSFISKTGHELVGSSTDPSVGIQEVHREEVDIVLLDMQMQPLSGMDVVPQLPDGVKVIFCSAYRNLAHEGYDEYNYHYLLKPLDFAKFCKVLQNTIATLDMRSIQGRGEFHQDFQFVKATRLGQVRVNYDRIAYVHAAGDRSVINFRDGTSLPISQRIGELYKEFPEKQFGRASKEIFVALAAIQRASSARIFMYVKGREVALRLSKNFGGRILEWVEENS